MSAALSLPVLARKDLPGRLAEGATVLAASRRLARSLIDDFNQIQAAGGCTVWSAPDCLPWSAWILRAYGELDSARFPVDARAEAAMWDHIVDDWACDRPLLAPTALSETAREAWKLTCEWGLGERLAAAAVSEDHLAFLAWAREFESWLERLDAIDSSRLPQALAAALRRGEGQAPASLICAGFDLLTPAQQDLLQALAERGCELFQLEPHPREAKGIRVACADGRAELRVAADWAAARLAAYPDARIGVVVPDLAERRAAVASEFARALANAAERSDGEPRYNLSLGIALAETGLADTALATIELVQGDLPFARASSWLRSPFIAGAERELGGRAELDARLREHSGSRLRLAQLRRAAKRSVDGRLVVPSLAGVLDELADWANTWRGQRLPPSAWVEPIVDLLKRAGLPGESALDSALWQAWEGMREELLALARLDQVSGRIGLARALAYWRRWLGQTLFQPEGSAAPVQILGLLEAAPLRFEHLWVCGLTEDRWPPPSRPNPLLPLSLQRDAGLPGASPAAALVSAERLVEGLARAAPELVLSWPRLEGDAELAPSPLIARWPEGVLEPMKAPARALERLAEAAPELESLVDEQGPQLSSRRLAGGASTFRDQAACPFRAFAVHRLGSRALGEPVDELSASDRGGLLHKALAEFWAELGDSQALARCDRDALVPVAARAAGAAIAWLRRHREVGEAYADLESARLSRVLLDWSELERERAPFTVHSLEASLEAEFAGLSLTVRPDRIDRLADGELVMLDYKTGRPSPSAWFGHRPDEPQLPLYALLAEAPVAAIAFAQLRPGESGFKGVAREAGVLPGVDAWDAAAKQVEEHGPWRELPARWQETLSRLAAEYSAGRAEVDPKSGPQTCTWCEQQAFCRIHELRQFDAGSVESAASDTHDSE